MEDYVSFEQAKALKELGFNWKCNHFYKNDVFTPYKPYNQNLDTLTADDLYYSSNDIYFICSKELGKDDNHIKDIEDYIDAPTLAQAAKWLRGKGIDIDITLFRDIDARGDNPVIKRYYNCEIAFDEDDEDLYEDFASYEQALSAGIDKALKLIINHEITDTI